MNSTVQVVFAIVREIDEMAADTHIVETFDEALHHLAGDARQTIGAHQSTISYLPNGDFHDAIHAHSFSRKYGKYNTTDVMPREEGIWGAIVEQKIPMRMTHEALLAHPRWEAISNPKDKCSLGYPPLRNWLAVPVLRRDGEIIGVIQLRDKYKGDFTEQNQALLSRLSNVISAIFDIQYSNNREPEQRGFKDTVASTASNSRLHDEIRETQEALEQQIWEAREGVRERTIIAEIGRIISSSLEIDQVYEQFAKQVQLLIPFDRISINSFDFDSYTFQTTYIMGLDVPERIKNVTLSLGESISEQVIRTRSEILIEAENETEIVDRYPTLLPSFRAGLRSFLAVPLIYKDEVVGALHLRSCAPKAYLDYHRALAGQIGNQIAGAIASAQLFREFTKAQDSLIQAERNYRNLSESSSDSIIVLKEGKTVYRNRIYQGLMGFSIEETADQRFLDTVAPEDREQVGDYYQRLLRGEDVPDQYEVRLLTREKRLVVMEVKPTIIEYEGQPATMVTMRDITQRRLIEEQLLQSQKMEVVGQLAGGIAHDFNNLLTGILGFSQMGDRSLPEDRMRDYFRQIGRAAERAASLTRQLLAFSRRDIVQLRILDLNVTIVEMDKMLRRLIGEDINMVTLPAPNLGTVKVDPGQIEQVLINMVVNAKDAIAVHGTLTIETANVTIGSDYLRRRPEASAGDYVMLGVNDTGIGMSEEVRTRIFEPFFTTKEVGKGTGLGLSTCYGIVEQSGGFITVDSELGKGTTFKVCLPRAEEEVGLPAALENSGQLPMGTETVLVVEDEPVVREVAATILKEQGYCVLKADNGSEALVVAQNADVEIDLLMTDVVMPVMGGRQLAEKFKELHPKIKVLFVSGHTDDALFRYGVLNEDTEFMQKPFTHAVLARRVRNVIDGI